MGLASLLVAAPLAAAPQANTASAAAEDPAALIAYQHRTADRVTPLPGTARPFAQAKRHLARGDPKAALAALKGQSGGLLADREALLTGDALLALGKKPQAKAAYLEAIELARVESVALLAARGLVDVHGELGDRATQLRYVDALLTVRRISRRANLMFTRAELLRALGRYEEAAAQAWSILLDHPTAHVAGRAETMLRGLEKRGVKMPTSTTRLELARVRNLIRSRAWARAEAAIAKLEKTRPDLKRALTMKRAELHKGQRQRKKEAEVLTELYRAGLTDDDGPAILFRLGRLSMSADMDDQALAYFDELVRTYPKSKERREGQYLAGWIPYNRGKYAEAVKRMLAFAEDFPRAAKRTEALWWAGWAAYVADDHGRARTAFEQLISDHPTSSLVPHARYWIGRIRHKSNETELAKQAYREVLKDVPLSYYGFWASARLSQLGETIVLTAPPPVAAPASLREVLARLGANRPNNLDRAVVLNAAGLDSETREELQEAERFLRKVRDTGGRTMVADMLAQLGAHHMAFRTAMRITKDGAELETGEPWAWRAWRHAYPKAFERYVDEAEKAHDIDGDLVLSLMRTESHFRPHVRSRVGARGLMQLMPNTARLIGKKAPGGRRHAARYRQPDSNVWLGGWYIKQLMLRYGGQIAAAAGAYNAGPRSMDRWLAEFGGLPLDEFVERIPYRETRRYVRRVIETFMVYRHLYGGDEHELISKAKKVAPPPDSVKF